MTLWDAFDLVMFGTLLGIAFCQTVLNGHSLLALVCAVFAASGVCMILAKFGLLS